MEILFCIAVCLTPFINARKYEEDSVFSSHGSYSLAIEHSFGHDDVFASRGHIQFKTSKVTTATFTNDIELSNEEVKKLDKLVGEDGLYMIRSPSKIGGIISDDKKNGSGVTQYVSTFVRACYLYGSGLREVIKIAVDNSGNVIGLSIVSPPHSCDYAKTKGLDSYIFNTTVLVHQQVPGAVPDTQTYIKKIEQEKSEQASGKGKDNRSFFAKYWMYILPVFLVLMLSAQAEPPAEGE